MRIFHGGCHTCTQQELKGLDFCVKCQYFVPDWSLPNLNNYVDDTEEIKIALKIKHGISLTDRDKFALSIINEREK